MPRLTIVGAHHPDAMELLAAWPTRQLHNITAHGGTVEVNQDHITVGPVETGEELFVDILRLGRISVFWRTLVGWRSTKRASAADAFRLSSAGSSAIDFASSKNRR